MDVTGGCLETSDKLLGFQIPDIDFAVKSAAVQEGSFTRQRQDGFALFSTVLERVDDGNVAVLGRVDAPEHDAAIAAPRD